MINTLQDKVKPYARAIVRLLKKDIDSRDKNWKQVLNYQVEISEYVNQIGLELIVNKEDGYAFLKQFPLDDEGNTINLTTRHKIGFETSVILVLLREILEEFEGQAELYVQEKFITHGDIREKAELLFKEKNDTVRFFKDIDKSIKQAVDLGYLKVAVPADNQYEIKYQIRRIIKSKVTINDLQDFNDKLKHYVEEL